MITAKLYRAFALSQELCQASYLLSFPDLPFDLATIFTPLTKLEQCPPWGSSALSKPGPEHGPLFPDPWAHSPPAWFYIFLSEER